MGEMTWSSEKEGERFEAPDRANTSVKKRERKVLKRVGIGGVKYQVRCVMEEYQHEWKETNIGESSNAVWFRDSDTNEKTGSKAGGSTD